MQSKIFLAIALCYTTSAFAKMDTLYSLSSAEYLSIMEAFHPVVLSADLQVQHASAKVLEARGAFDPQLKLEYKNKTLDSKNYYEYTRPQVIVPIWYGMDITAGVEHSGGDRINPESTPGQLQYAGARLKLSSLFYDSRRAILRQAQSIKGQLKAERRIIVNDVIADGLSKYYNWQQAYAMINLLLTARNNAAQRVAFVKQEYEQGAKAAIDTVEAITQLQSFQLQYTEALLEFENSGLEMANYLWYPNGTPFEKTKNLIPQSNELEIVLPDLDSFLLVMLSQHPKLLSLSRKQEILRFEGKLKQSYLLPEVSLKADLINDAAAIGYPVFNNDFMKNNRVGFDVSLPLFMRSARGAYKGNKIKMEQVELDIANTENLLRNKVRISHNKVRVYLQQFKIYTEAVQNFQRLYEGEVIKYSIGESDLFMLNSRQLKVVDAEIKRVILKNKLQQAMAELNNSGGLPN